MWFLCNNYEKNWFTGSPMTPCGGQESAGMACRPFSAFFWNSCGVLHDRLLEMSLMVPHKVNYHKLTTVANKMLFPLRENIETERASAFARHCSYSHNKSKKNWSSTWDCYAYHHSLYSSSIASNDAHLFHFLQHFLAAKLCNEVEDVKTCLTKYFV